jgi:integrase
VINGFSSLILEVWGDNGHHARSAIGVAELPFDMPVEISIFDLGLRKGWCEMTGLRQGELLGLRWRDVDLNARKIRVVSPFVRGEFGDPKSAGSGRSVPMAERVADALGELRERSYYAHDRHLVSCHPKTGKPLDRSKLVRRFKQAIDRAGVHRITAHELRHTFGTRMAAAGTPMRTLQHWMGHADSKTTQIYAHYQPSDQEADAVDRIRVTLGSARPVRARVPRGTARSSPGRSR